MKTIQSTKILSTFKNEYISTRAIARKVVQALKDRGDVAKVVDCGTKADQRWQVEMVVAVPVTLSVSRKPKGNVLTNLEHFEATQIRSRNQIAYNQGLERVKSVPVYIKPNYSRKANLHINQ